MIENPWPLICFSLLIQMSVGCFMISESTCLAFSRRFSSAGLRLVRLVIRSLVLAISLLAVIVSFFHLGKPWRVLNILNNLNSSWLSLEIIFLIMFIFVVAAGIILEWRKRRGRKLQKGIFLLGGLFGLSTIVAMFNLYMLPTVPAWKSIATPVVFLLVCFLLGSQLTASSWTIYLRRSKNTNLTDITTHWSQRTLGRIENLSLVLVMIIVLVAALLLIQNYSVLGLIRILLSLCGALLLWRGWPVVSSSPKKKQMSDKYVSIAFVVLLLAEVLGRILFFASYDRIGL